ncbi:hypothetical protein DOY81_003343 [Sarcophaga bullata]|nr:hypothetical protein DOY81_003343 [Sarcophaga bullata]
MVFGTHTKGTKLLDLGARIDCTGGSGTGGGGGKHQKQSVIVGSSSTSKHGHQQQQQTPDMQPSSVTHDVVDGQPLETQTNNHSTTKQTHHHTQQQHHNHNTHHHQQQRSEEHIRLEEFTCDVSVEGGKSSQPLQFSFTFYDLDGHHGKITKDDIVGIVYTIYESIGKSVVVPHSGSKTINVRLTVSPEGKTKATKNKKALDHHSLNLNQKPSSAAALASNNIQATRRLHRYRPRKLIKSDEEDDDSNSDKERDLNLAHILAHKAASKAHKLGKLKASEQHCCSQQMAHQQQQQQPALNDLPDSPLDTAAIYDNLKASSPLEACRECIAAAADGTRNATATSPLVSAATTTTSPAQFPAASSKTTNEAYMKHVASTRIKMLRKSRKQKHQDCLETRQRSLSVGNETCWKNRHLQTKHSNSSSNNTQQQLLWQAEQHLNNSAVVGGGNSNSNGNGSDMADGVQLRNPLKNTKSMMASSSSSAHKRNSAECWKTALNRNDLISIIRESMEKNRLCFQLNGKPQANVSPIRQQTNTNINNPHQQTQPHNPQVASNSSKHTQQHQATPIPGCQQQQHQQQQQRQRSNTVSKIPTLIANHNNTQQSAAISPQHQHPQRSSSCANTISNNCNNHSHSHGHSHDTSLANEPYSHSNSSNSSNNHHYHHHQPHIPIYHQQMAINPAVIAAQNALLTATASGNVGSPLLQQHGKMNLCGYDSFLHATICGGGLSHSPPPPPPPSVPLPAQASTNHTSLNTQITVSSNTNLSQHQHQQQIATVQPIMAQNAATSKHLNLAVTPQQLKSGKILRQTANSTPSQSQHHQHQHHSYTNTTQNSPQYHGYQRLPSSSKHNLSALHLLSPNTEKPSLSELDKWRRDQVKSYDQLLYAKLSEKLQQTNLVSSSANARDCNQRRKQRVTRQRRATALQQEDQATTNNSLPSTVLSNSICLREPTDYNSVIPIVGDPVECENLLGQTSDEDINSPQEVNPSQLKGASENRQVVEATLVDIDKITDELTAQKANLTLNVDTLLSVDDTEEVHNLHSLHGDDLEIDEDLEEEEELDEELEDLCQVVESGRNSKNSNNSSNANTANTNTATNNGANNSTSSLIHRYVHEHIHHHYHHFEEKEE